MTRRDSRILALNALFCWEVGKTDPREYFDILKSETEREFEVEPDSMDYAWELVKAVVSNIEDIDEAIGRVSKGWAVSRMPKADLCIVRLAYAEAVILKSAPHEVVLDEAIELAKVYGTHASPSFVNGVLVAIFVGSGWSENARNRYGL